VDISPLFPHHFLPAASFFFCVLFYLFIMGRAADGAKYYIYAVVYEIFPFSGWINQTFNSFYIEAFPFAMQMSQHNNEEKKGAIHSLFLLGIFDPYRSPLLPCSLYIETGTIPKSRGSARGNSIAHTQTSALLALLSYTASNSKKKGRNK